MEIDKTRGGGVSGIILVGLEQFGNVHAQGGGDAFDHQDRRIALSGLDTAEVGLVDARSMGDLLLREFLLPSDSLDVSRHARLDRHAQHRASRLPPKP